MARLPSSRTPPACLRRLVARWVHDKTVPPFHPAQRDAPRLLCQSIHTAKQTAFSSFLPMPLHPPAHLPTLPCWRHAASLYHRHTAQRAVPRIAFFLSTRARAARERETREQHSSFLPFYLPHQRHGIFVSAIPLAVLHHAPRRRPCPRKRGGGQPCSAPLQVCSTHDPQHWSVVFPAGSYYRRTESPSSLVPCMLPFQTRRLHTLPPPLPALPVSRAHCPQAPP